MGRRGYIFSAAFLGAAFASAPTFADPQSIDVVTEFSAERGYTSNALDREVPVSDWVNSLRGGVAVTVPHEGGKLKLGLDAEQSAHDVFSIEDDSALRLSLSGEHAATDRLSFGGNLGFGVISEGDDIDIEGLVLGIRTRTVKGSLALMSGYRITEKLILSGEVTASRSQPGLTAFEAELVAPQQLSPRRDAAGGGLRLSYASGKATYTAVAGAEARTVGAEGQPPYDFSFGRQFARGEVAAKVGGFELSAAGGAERIAGVGGTLDIARPALAAAAAYRFAGGATLRGSVSAAVDLEGGDDPLGSWLREIALEATLPISSKVTVSAGLAVSRRENFMLGYEEDAGAAFLGAKVALGHGLALGFDLGASSRRPLPAGAPIESVDAGITLSYALPAPKFESEM